MSQMGMLPQVLGPRWNRSWLTFLSLLLDFTVYPDQDDRG